MFPFHARRSLKLMLSLAVVLSAFATGAFGAAAQGAPGVVYTMTNEEAGNAIITWQRGADGSLEMSEAFPTGGDGSGGGLGSQGALVLSRNGQWLLAVNAGSNEISAFQVHEDGPELTSTVDSGGEMPISVTIHNRLVYVLNAGGDGNITGFVLDDAGTLVPLDGATRGLSQAGGAGPAQVQFTPAGDMLVVTEKATNRIDVYAVDENGIAGSAVVNDSHGATPFGFDFAQQGTLVVSEAFGGAENASAVSTYVRNTDGTLQLVSGSVATTESAACWVATTPDGRRAYTTNAGSGSVSAFGIRSDGRAFLVDGTIENLPEDGQAGLTGEGSSPIDAAVSRDGQYLYVLNGGTDSVSVLAIDTHGDLSEVGQVTGLAASSVGIAAG
jgi:6-phosphogluconolactonase (cycloisomerase 2 family)